MKNLSKFAFVLSLGAAITACASDPADPNDPSDPSDPNDPDPPLPENVDQRVGQLWDGNPTSRRMVWCPRARRHPDPGPAMPCREKHLMIDLLLTGGTVVTVDADRRVILDGAVAIYDGAQCVAQHALQPATQGWVTVPDHHAGLWADTLAVERRPLAVYEEVATWS